MTMLPPRPVESFTIICGPTSSQVEITIAVGLFDASADRLFMRFRRDLQAVISEEEIEVVSGTEKQFLTLIAENGATATVEWMQETLSNFVRFDGPRSLERPNQLEAVLDELYDQNIILKNPSRSGQSGLTNTMSRESGQDEDQIHVRT